MSGIEGPGIIGGGGGGGAPATATFLTATDQTATLPNSRTLTAGANITLDAATPGVLGIAAVVGGTVTSIVLQGPESLSGAAVLSPAALAAGTTNNWAPAGLATARQIRVSTNNAGSSLSGIDATGLPAGMLLTLENLGPTGELTLLDQNAGSTATNRIIGVAATDFGIPVGDSITLFYDATTTRWRKSV